MYKLNKYYRVKVKGMKDEKARTFVAFLTKESDIFYFFTQAQEIGLRCEIVDKTAVVSMVPVRNIYDNVWEEIK